MHEIPRVDLELFLGGFLGEEIVDLLLTEGKNEESVLEAQLIHKNKIHNFLDFCFWKWSIRMVDIAEVEDQRLVDFTSL